MRTVGLSLAAAALLVCCLMPALYRLLPLGAVDHTPAFPTLHYATRIGEHHTVLLPDGSSVVLNTNSQIDVQFTADSRDVHLRRGEAHFDVAKDSSRPFRVYANGGVVEAVGTAFTVQESGAEGLEVTVVEGVVNVTPLLLPLSEPAAKHEGEESLTQSEPAPVTKASERAPIALSAGESVQLTQQSEDVVKQKFRPDQLESKLAWRDGMLLFEGDPLEKVVREVSRYTAIRIDVDASVRDIEVLGYFRTGDIDGILLTMRDTFGVKVERLSEDHIVLKADN